MFKFCSIIKPAKKLMMLLSILFLGCHGKKHNEENLSDTMVTSQKVKLIKNGKTSADKNVTAVENQIIGKTFVGKLSQSCVMTTNGGYDIFNFLLLTFNKDTVSVSQQRIDIETRIISKKAYSWEVSGNSVIINDYNDYGILHFKVDTLNGTKPDGSIIKFINTDVHQYLKRKNNY